jgi:hypothetical protein
MIYLQEEVKMFDERVKAYMILKVKVKGFNKKI